jgi:hypothetical protein
MEHAAATACIEWLDGNKESLTSLSIKLDGNRVGGLAGQNLAEKLLQCTALRSLSLDMRETQLGSLGCNALVGLFSHMSLEDLVLRLHGL